MDLNELLKREDIGATAKIIMLALPSEPMHVRELPERTGISLRTVYRAIDTLLDAGLVLREERGHVTRNVNTRSVEVSA